MTATRPIRGRLNGVHAEPGTIVGPTDVTREFLVVVDQEAAGVMLGYATAAEFAATRDADGPRSVTEARNWNIGRLPDWLRREA